MIKREMHKKLLFTIFTLVFIISEAQTNITQFNTLIKPNHNIGLSNPLWNQGSLMTYDASQVNTNGGAFSLNFVNPGGPGYKGYPSGTIGAFKGGGNYTPGNISACGLPIQISNLNHDLRIKWKVSQFNANDVDDKWWASINVIFDSTPPTLEPLPQYRDYDLVIELNRYEQEIFQDVSSATNQVYWYYARNADNSLKTLDFNYNGVVYSWVVRYKFFNYPPTHANYDNNDKVHVKFTPLFNSNVAPFLDHSLKKFIQTSVDFLQYVNLTPAELALSNAKVGHPNLYIKNINAGYEVYTGAFTITNDYFYTILDANAPANPTNLVATKVMNNVSLDWEDNVDLDFNTYKIYRAINGGNHSLLADNVNTSSYIDSTTTIGNTYSYYVVADDRSYNVSIPSNSQSVSFGILNTDNFESEDDFILYSNPHQATFTIETKLQHEAVQLYSIDGKLIPFIKEGNLYSVSNLSKGVYYIRAIFENKTFNKKIILN
jgi:hypothetical protein